MVGPLERQQVTGMIRVSDLGTGGSAGLAAVGVCGR